MTDHAAAAQTALDIWSEYPFPDDDPQEIDRQHLAEAQVHAALALVEAQQTANLIAALAAGYHLDFDHEAASRIRLLLATRLGLTPTPPNQEQNRRGDGCAQPAADTKTEVQWGVRGMVAGQVVIEGPMSKFQADGHLGERGASTFRTSAVVSRTATYTRWEDAT